MRSVLVSLFRCARHETRNSGWVGLLFAALLLLPCCVVVATNDFILRVVQLSCIIGPNGQRMPGCIRQCLTGQPSIWQASGVVVDVSSNKKVSRSSSWFVGVSFVNIRLLFSPSGCRESANSRRSSSTDRKYTLHTDDQGSCDDLLPSRSYLDDVQPPPQQPSSSSSQQQQQQPGANMLSQNEIKLCSSLNMQATRYITLKTVLLSGSDHSYAIKQEPLGSHDSKSVLGVGPATGNGAAANSSHIGTIKKYLTKAGWLAGSN